MCGAFTKQAATANSYLYNNTTPGPSSKKRRTAESLLWETLDELVNDETEREPQPPSRDIDTELSQYLSEPLLPRKEDPLVWWRQNVSRFPCLGIVARAYLGAPPTSVPSERLFSVAGGVLSERRSSLLPENASRLIFMKYNSGLLLLD
jgi:hypothetical protein